MAVEETGHVSDKSATFSGPLSSVEDHKAFKRGQWKGSEEKVESLSVNGAKTNMEIESCIIYTNAQIGSNFNF
jgi:hypothetical protein